MDLRKLLDSLSIASRQEEINNSNRLSLWEIILKLETISNKNLPLVFDIEGTKPMWMWSWRWIYAELAIFTDELWSIYTWEMWELSGWYKYPLSENLWKENPNVEEWLNIMKRCVWSTFWWYKWWDFKMNKNTPISVCRATNNVWFKYDEDNSVNTFILDIVELPECVVFITWKED